MKSPLAGGFGWLVLDEVGSTQDEAERCLKEDLPYGVVFALNQTQGRGRHGRVWLSEPGDSLTMSMIFRGYTDAANPHLVGMAVAIAAATCIRAQLQWPNDLVIQGKKTGGIITELKRDSQNRVVPIVGLGINLNQQRFPNEIAERATSVQASHGVASDARQVAENVIAALSALPEITDWLTLREVWNLYDRTPGKKYRISEKEVGIAIGIGSSAELICSVDGTARSVLAADAIFGADGLR